MKRTIHIHLGGMPFIIEDDAFETLNEYLESLKRKFTNPNEQKEIIEDIESRMADVFAKKLDKTKLVLSNDDVLEIINQLGHPEEIGEESSTQADELVNELSTKNSFENKTFSQAGDKKLFRDYDNRILGGVLAGLCQFFGWKETLWLRLAFIALLWFSCGTALFIYIILWLLIPRAETHADKLQMRGEAVTIETIEREVRDTITRTESAYKASGAQTVVDKVITIFLLLLKGFLRVAAFFVLLFSMLFLLVFAMMLFGVSMFGMPSFADYTQLIFNSRDNYLLMALFFGLTIGIPLFWLMYSSVAYLFRGRVSVNKNIGVSLFVAWVISFIGLVILSSGIANGYKTLSTKTMDIQINQPSAETLVVRGFGDSTTTPIDIQIDDDDEDAYMKNVSWGKSENGFLVGVATLSILPSEDSLFHVSEKLSARGKNKSDANKQISMINIQQTQTDSILTLKSSVEIYKNARWRNQSLKHLIYVPAGKKVTVDASKFNIENVSHVEGAMTEAIFTNENGIIKCLNCLKDDESSSDKDTESEEDF